MPAPVITLAGGVTRFLALHRQFTTWVVPVYGTTWAELPGEVQFLLWEREDGRIGLALPLVHEGRRAYLRGGDSTELVIETEHLPVPVDDHYLGLFTAEGDDPISLTRWAVAQVARQLGTFALRTEKSPPSYLDLFGWCTWDAFYGEVSAKKFLEGLAAWQGAGQVVPWVILDDGWQAQREGRMAHFGAQEEKFPGGLAPLLAEAKTRFGVRHAGVWHAQQGHWNGVEAGLGYPVVTTHNSDPRARNSEMQGKTSLRQLVDPAHAHDFYDRWHLELRAQGADMVKIDNQSAMDLFASGVLPVSTTQGAYQRALQASATKHFGGELLQCMSHGSDVFFNLGRGASVMRNSFDFQPRMPERQQRHLCVNAANAILHHTVVTPDWDMFQSVHPAAALHAASRAISGGPVYVSDKPGEHDLGILARLVLPDGRVLRCEEPALPADDVVFTDCYREPVPLKIVNRNGHTAVIGLFHCLWAATDPGPVSGAFAVADARGLDPAVDDYALYFHQSGGCLRTTRATRHPVTLESHGFEIVTAAPVRHGVAVFGLIDMYNGSRAVMAEAWVGNWLTVDLMAGGRVGFYAEDRPRVLVGGEEVPVVEGLHGLWTICTEGLGPLRVEVEAPVGEHERLRGIG